MSSSPSPKPTRKPKPAAAPAAAIAAPAVAPASDVPDTLELPLTPAGVADLARMREGSRLRLRQALPAEVLSQLGAAEPAEMKLAQAAGIFKAIGGTLKAIAPYAGIPPVLAELMFTYTREDLEILAEPTAAILNKRGGALMGKYREEFLFVSALVEVHAAKFELLQKQIAAATAAARRKADGSAAEQVQ